MDRLWNWHQNGNRTDNIDSFITDLQKVNEQKGLLFRHQMLNSGEVGASTALLLAMAQQSPQVTNKVVKAALGINQYLNTYYADSKNQLLNAEKLAVPAMLEALKPQIQKNVKDSSLCTKAFLLISKTKSALEQEMNPLNRNIYDNFVSSYAQTLSSGTHSNPPMQKPRTVYEV